MERSCELCSKPARMYCESDEARLCWDCDERVHGANFLVAKHSRSLLCHVCQSPTPWKASGTKLSPSISVCEGCFDNSNYAQNPSTARMRIRRQHPGEEEHEGDATDQSAGMDDGDRDSESSAGSTEDDDDEEEEEEEEVEQEEEEDGENQVVPWASCPSPSVSSAPPLTTSSSSSEHGSLSTRNDALKRSRGSRIQESDDEDVCCSSQANSNMAAINNTKVASLRAAKMARVEDHPELRRRMELVGSLMSFQESTAAATGGHNRSASEVIRRISELSKDAA